MNFPTKQTIHFTKNTLALKCQIVPKTCIIKMIIIITINVIHWKISPHLRLSASVLFPIHRHTLSPFGNKNQASEGGGNAIFHRHFQHPASAPSSRGVLIDVIFAPPYRKLLTALEGRSLFSCEKWALTRGLLGWGLEMATRPENLF